MAIRVALNHVSHYKYDRLVSLSPHVVRLRPAPHCRTPITAYSLRVTPEEHFINWQQDPFGNYQARLVFPKPARELRVEVDLVAEMTTINPFDFFLDDAVQKMPFSYTPEMLRELAPYMELSLGLPLMPLEPLLSKGAATASVVPSPLIDRPCPSSAPPLPK